ncbi:MAG: hypothetical protein NTW30_02450 [Candidatus Aenigmarchaeota archaeon]|nr:hypothetical protein [Candidatus Aenigmarchaeota archaeon]
MKELKLNEDTYHFFADKFYEDCNDIEDFEKRITCKTEKLHVLTRVQDIMNLNIIGEFHKKFPSLDEERRWIPMHMVDNANAIILGITDARYRPDIFWHQGSYVKEKMDSLESKRWSLGKPE